MESIAAGILDHIAIVVHNIDDARKFYTDVLGGRFMYELERAEKGYRLCKIELHRVAIELLEPLGADSFLHGVLAKRGEGLHHITFNIPGSKYETDRLRECGVRIAEEVEEDGRHEAYISPRSSHGVLIQMISGYSAWSLANDYHKRKRSD